MAEVILIYSSFMAAVKSTRQKNELNRYLEDDVEDDHPKFDIFNWWKFKASKYYIFSCMNRYIFVIHVSYIVSSEFVFSIRDRILDSFRSFLSPTIIDALICAQN